MQFPGKKAVAMASEWNVHVTKRRSLKMNRLAVEAPVQTFFKSTTYTSNKQAQHVWEREKLKTRSILFLLRRIWENGELFAIF